MILQRYAQRFSISETVLERLQLPKLLDRSISADPSFPLSLSLSSSPTTPDPFDIDPNGPMKYLRQQSAPTPKFTSTLEARIEEFPKDSSSHTRPQIRSRSTEPPSTRALSPKPMPLLTPKPYFHSRPTAPEPSPTKVSHKMSRSIPNITRTMKPPGPKNTILIINLPIGSYSGIQKLFLYSYQLMKRPCSMHGLGCDFTFGYFPVLTETDCTD